MKSDAERLRILVCKCGHEWSRHDPEDGECDAAAFGPTLDVCPCRTFRSPDPNLTLHEYVSSFVLDGLTFTPARRDNIQAELAVTFRLYREQIDECSRVEAERDDWKWQAEHWSEQAERWCSEAEQNRKEWERAARLRDHWKGEHDAANQHADDFRTARDDVVRQLDREVQRVAALEAALREYAWHKVACLINEDEGADPCTCGLAMIERDFRGAAGVSTTQEDE